MSHDSEKTASDELGAIHLNFSWFNAGSYSFSSAGPFATTEATLTNSIVFNVGSISNVPEPMSVALLGLGLVGVGLSRRLKKA